MATSKKTRAREQAVRKQKRSAKKEPEITAGRSVFRSGDVFEPGDEDRLAAQLTEADRQFLTKKGIISNFPRGVDPKSLDADPTLVAGRARSKLEQLKEERKARRSPSRLTMLPPEKPGSEPTIHPDSLKAQEAEIKEGRKQEKAEQQDSAEEE